MKQVAIKSTMLMAVLAMALCMFGLCTVQSHASTDLSKCQLKAAGCKAFYTYDGTANGADNYKIYAQKDYNDIDITDSVTVTQKKHKDCGQWYVKVTAKKDSDYTGSAMVRAFSTNPAHVSSLNAKYKNKKTTVTFKMPKMKKGYYEFYIYSGASLGAHKYSELTKSQKSRVIKFKKSKRKAWKKGESVKISIPKKLSKGTYRISVKTYDTGYTNKSGHVKRYKDFGWGTAKKVLVVK